MSCEPQRPRFATAICVVGLCSFPAQSVEPSGVHPAVASRGVAEVADVTNVEGTHPERAPFRALAGYAIDGAERPFHVQVLTGPLSETAFI